GEWGLESAHLGLEQFIHFLCVQDAFNNRYSDSEDFEAYITREITTSKEWLRYLERLESIAETELNKPEELVTIAVEKSKNDRKSEREAIRASYFASFPEKITILDVCWAAKQRYREWIRWTGGELKNGSKPDMAFRAVLLSGKRPEEYRADPRPKGWK